MHALASLLGRAVVAGYLLSDPCQSKPDNEHIGMIYEIKCRSWKVHGHMEPEITLPNLP